MKNAGVTTVIYTGDPLTPAALTKEATAQDYRPEWIVGPTVLADTTFFGRTFDQAEWAHAFGVALVNGGASRRARTRTTRCTRGSTTSRRPTTRTT
jgi:hypothetical protein